MPIFLDTNVFLYAAGQEHPFKAACVGILKRVADGRLEATVNSEVVQEILYVLARRGRRMDGVTLARHVAALFPDLVPVSRDDMLKACDLVQKHPDLPARDAVHAATMLRHGIRRIVSTDADFNKVAGIERLDPDQA